MDDDFNFDYSEECDYNALKKSIAKVLRKYFRYDDNGTPTDEYDPSYSATGALNDIHDIIGDI